MEKVASRICHARLSSENAERCNCGQSQSEGLAQSQTFANICESDADSLKMIFL